MSIPQPQHIPTRTKAARKAQEAFTRVVLLDYSAIERRTLENLSNKDEKDARALEDYSNLSWAIIYGLCAVILPFGIPLLYGFFFAFVTWLEKII